MTASTRQLRRPSALLLLLLLPWLASSAVALSPQVLLVFDPDDPVSVMDARGIREALAEQRTPWLDLPLGTGQSLSAATLHAHATAVLAQVPLDTASAAAARDWVATPMVFGFARNSALRCFATVPWIKTSYVATCAEMT